MALFGAFWKVLGVKAISGTVSESLSSLRMARLATQSPQSGIALKRVEYKPVPMLGMCVCQTREFAARRGTREKWYKLKRAKKLQIAASKAAEPSKWIRKSKALIPTRFRTTNLFAEREIIDDVYIEEFFRRRHYSIKEGIEMHRETHHPTVYNQPDAPVYLSLELDMSLEKKTKFLDGFTDITPKLHDFDDGKTMTILAFCKKPEEQEIAINSGATVAGGQALIKQVLAGEVLLGEFKYIVCQADMVNDIGALRGLMKKRLPSVAKGTIGIDMKMLVERFTKGIEYSAEKDTIQHNFGWVDVQVGTLKMKSEHLEENIASVVSSVCKRRPPKLGPFITMALLSSPPSKEKIAVNINKYMPIVEEDDSDDEVAKTAASR